MNQIYLDVDGCLNPITHKQRTKHWVDYKRTRVKVRDGEYPIWYSKGMGIALLSVAADFDAEIVWSTTWTNDANTHISPLVGLPTDLRVAPYDYNKDGDIHNCGKIPAIASMCEENAIVIIDDYLGFGDKCWIKEREFPTLGIKPVENIGITPQHIVEMRNFFASL